MENASKALIIAGAILVSILIISLGVMIFNSATPDTKGWDEKKIATYNADFEKYEGPAQRGTTVKQMIKDVYQHNVSNVNDQSLQVSVTGESTTDSQFAGGCKVTKGEAIASGTSTTGISKAQSTVKDGKTYKVECEYDTTGGGLVTNIKVTPN